MTTRKYSSRSQQTTLTAAVTAGAGSITVQSATTLLGGATVPSGTTFTIVIDPDTALEEIVDVTAVSGTAPATLAITRGVENAGTGSAHSAGAVVRHMAIGRDFREANLHIEATEAYNDGTGTHTLHGIGSSEGSVVGTDKTQTLTNKTLTSPTITGTGAIAGTFTGNLTGNVTGNASTATALATGRNFQLTGDVEASAVSFNGTGNVSLVTSIGTGAIVNADVNASAAIAYSKLNLGSSIVNADIASGAAIDKSKISGTAITAADTGTVTSTMIADGAIVNADVNTSAQIAYSKLNLTNTIVNADINASAAIDKTKISGTAITAADTGTVTNTMLAGSIDVTKISNFDAEVQQNRLDQMAAPTGSVSLNSQKITNLATPTSNTDAATKAYADLMIPLTQKGVANGVAELDADGLVPTHHLPALAITTTQVVSSQAAMLALTAQVGDVAVRTDLNKSFILTATPASTLGNWQELLTPTDAVLSVDGRTGAVTLSDLYDAAGSAASKLPLAGGTMTGAIAMGTNKITGMGDPTSAQDAATKNYVDTAAIAPSNLTGPITSVGPATSVASQTGTGSTFVMQASPTLTTPDIGVATATSINGTAIPSSKTLVATDSTTYVVPSQTGNSGKYLTTNGTTSSWGVVDALPSQTGNAGKYLTTNGTSASWASIVTDPTPSIFMLMGA